MSTVRHTGYNILGATIPVVVTLATVPLYLRVVGLERYGFLSICWVLVGYFGLFEFGLGPATAQRLAAVKISKSAQSEETFWGALSLSVAMGLIGAVALLLIGNPALSGVHSDTRELSSELPSAVYWLAALVPLTTSYGVLLGALQGRRRFGAMNAISSVGNVVIAAAPLAVAIAMGPGLFNLVATIACAKLLVNIALFLACRSAVPIRSFRSPRISTIIALCRFGGWVTISSVITPILVSSDKLLIGWTLGAKNVSLYMVPFNAVSKMLIIPQSLSSALFPRFAALHDKAADDTESRALALISTALSVIIIIVIIGCRPFLSWWVGPAISAGSWRICVVLATGIWFNACSYIPHSKFQGTGRPDLVAKISAAQLIPYLAILYISIGWWGSLGAAVAWSFRVAIEMLIFFTVQGRTGALLRAVWQPAVLVLGSAVLTIAAPVVGNVCLIGLVFTSLGALLLTAIRWAVESSRFKGLILTPPSSEIEQY